MFEKGKSGNPSGRPREDPTLREAARSHTKEALDTLVAVMRAKRSPASAKVAAANALLDRGYGKPAQSMEVTGKDGADLAPKLDILEVARSLGFILASAAHQAEQLPS